MMKNIVILILVFASLLVPSALGACANKAEQETGMTLATSEIPLVDTLTPAKIETATFSLG